MLKIIKQCHILTEFEVMHYLCCRRIECEKSKNNEWESLEYNNSILTVISCISEIGNLAFIITCHALDHGKTVGSAI